MFWSQYWEIECRLNYDIHSIQFVLNPLSHMVMQVEHEPMQLVFEVSILLLWSLEEE